MIILNKIMNLIRRQSSRKYHKKMKVGGQRRYLRFGSVVRLETSKILDRAKEQILQLKQNYQVTVVIAK